jgi:AcrR family transcriptional regulator
VGVKERREREFKRREREILDAALRLLDGDDWLSVTIEQIAEGAEVGKGTVYKHFASKDELYARLSLDHCSDHLQALRGVDPTLPLEQRLRAMVQVYWDVHSRPGICHHVVEYCEADAFRRGLPDDLRLKFEGLESEIYDRIFATIQEGIEAGLFPGGAVAPLAMMARATLDGMIRLIRSGVISTDDEHEQLEAVTRFIMAGLAGSSHAEGRAGPA